MSLTERLNTRLLEAKAKAKLIPYLPQLLLPKSKWTLMVLLDWHALRRPNDIALKHIDTQLSWSELQQQVNRSALVLKGLGVQKGSKVVILLDNRPEFIINLLALSRLQAVSVLINTSVIGKSLAHCVNSAKASLCLVGEEHANKIDAILSQLDIINAEDIWLIKDNDNIHPETITNKFTSFTSKLAQSDATLDPALSIITGNKITDVCCYIYTSGTTGLPKPAIVSYQRILACGVISSKALLGLKPDETIYVPTPLFHSVGISFGLGSMMVSGAGLALRRGFSASQFWNDIRKYNASAFTYVGELCRYLVNQPAKDDDQSHPLRAIIGVGLRPDVWREFIDRFGDIKVCEIYGATEGSGLLCNYTGKIGMLGRKEGIHEILKCDLTTGDLIANSDGFYDKVSEGETGLLVVLISARSPFDGYIDESASEKKRLRNVLKKGDLYFNTGDLVNLHEDNWLSFADRVGDTYRWKGENVSTNEVAEILNACPNVLETNVYGVAVPGNEGRAGMASLNITSAFEISDLEKLIKAELANHQRPYFLRLQKEMRITQTFKHQKVEYQKEGFNPTIINDPLFLLQQGKYQQLDKPLFNGITNGTIMIK